MFLLSANLDGQIEVASSTLPEIGDVLVYNTFTLEDDTLSYRMTGENVEWNFEGLIIDTIEEELYIDIDTTDLRDSFPDADMLLDGIGFTTAAKLNTNSIELLGILLPDFGFLGIQGVSYFDNPYEYKRVPINYGDSFEDAASLKFTFSTEFIPGLDSLEIPLPGATLDSLRFVVSLSKTEEAVGWGQLTTDSGTTEVLHIKQVDNFSNELEVGLNLFETVVWFPASEFLGDGGMTGFGSSETTTYKFLSADSKVSMLEFTEDRGIDSTGTPTLDVEGRMGMGAVAASIDRYLDSDQLNLYPNPTSSNITLNLDDDTVGFYELRIYDAQGRFIEQISNYQMSSLVDLPDLPKGSYFIELSDTQRSYMKRFVIIE